MKRALVLSLLLLLLPTHAIAAPTVTPLTKIESTELVDASGLAVNGSSILLFGTSNKSGFIRAITSDGSAQWKLILTSGVESIATAATIAPDGNIWVAGSSSVTITPAPVTATTPAVNPDGIVPAPVSVIRADLTLATLWKISPTGALLNTYTSDLKTPVLINGISANVKGLSLVGSVQTPTGSAGLLLDADTEGVFTPPFLLGKSDTSLESVIRASDGSVTAIGNSAEALAGKPLAGKRDGITAKIKARKITTLLRSSATRASRKWESATPTLFLGGFVQTGAKFETALTKFSKTLAPTWTYRFSSNGTGFTTVTPTGIHYAFFGSLGGIKTLPSWKPSKATGILLAFDAKGAISGGYSATGVSAPIALGYSKELGVIALGSGQLGVSLFRLTSR